MPDPAPPGVFPLFLRGATCEKYGFKTGEGVMDLVDYLYLSKDELVKEIQGLGVMSDFEPAKKQIESCPLDKVLVVVDKTQQYGEIFLFCHTEASQSEFFAKINEQLAALEEQRLASERAEQERIAAEFARLNVVFEDKPLTPRPWLHSTSADTEADIRQLAPPSTRDLLALDITRSKRLLRQKFRFGDRNAETAGVAEFRPYKDPNFKHIRESDVGIQVAPMCKSNGAQTNWFRSVNKSVQYEPAKPESLDDDSRNIMLAFLEKSVVKVERALQNNETIDIYHETFRIVGDEENADGMQAENELREIKNFADPTYSKSKVLSCIDWLPKSQGIVAVSAVRNISFDQRVVVSGQTTSSYILFWDFRQLVKPMLLLQSQNEVYTFKVCKTNPNIVVGGCISGQVVMWDITEAVAASLRKSTRGGSSNQGEEEDISGLPISPKYISHVDYSHRRSVADMFWLPATTQLNYRGQLVGQEYLDGQSYQFITVSGDGMIMVWDTRYEQIAADELKHVGKTKHVPIDKAAASKDAPPKLLWAPIFKAQIKRLEGVGEMSLCKICGSGTLKSTVAEGTTLPGDYRSHFLLTTEEGDIIFADLSPSTTRKEGGKEDEEEEVESGRDYARWIALDHPRPAVALQQSPFFPDIVLSVGDWNFHIWRVGEERPLFRSPVCKTYLTGGCWSPTRPAVVFVACADGEILAWDFTDTSVRSSVELKATHSKITSMEFLTGTTSTRQQLLAVGDETGTLHVFEMPRNFIRPVHKEEAIMSQFLDRETLRNQYIQDLLPSAGAVAEGGRGGGDTDAFGADSKLADDSAQDALKAAEKEALQKEEDEFAKMEAMFITELELKTDELPAFAKSIVPIAKPSK